MVCRLGLQIALAWTKTLTSNDPNRSGQAATAIQLQNGFSGLGDGVRDCLQKFERGQLQAEQLLKAGNVDMLAALTANVDTVRQLIASGSSEIRSHISTVHMALQKHRVSEERIGKLRDSLWFDDINSRRTQIDRSQASTFGWVFEPDELGEYCPLRQWLLNGKGLFWVKGKPGSGKSCFMKFLTQDKHTAELLDGHAIYSYFIWNSGSPLQRNRRGMLCSLLHQMLAANDSYSSQILQDCSRLSDKKRPSDWELEELETTLQIVLKLHTQRVCLFIDGLDELDRQDDNFDLRRLVRDTFASSSRLKMCVSSRPEPLWVSLLDGLPSIRLQDLTRKDHEIVARDLLQTYHKALLQHQDEKNIQDLVNTLVRKSEGVFLWLRLALKSLQRGLTSNDSFEELQKRIDALSSELALFYKSMWSRLGDDETIWRREAALYFQVFLNWPEVMSPHSFQLALASDDNLRNKVHRDRDQLLRDKTAFLNRPDILSGCHDIQKRVESRCAGLLEYSSPQNFHETKYSTVTFIHRTAREFLRNTQEGRQLLAYCSKEVAVENIIRTLICTAALDDCMSDSCEWRWLSQLHGWYIYGLDHNFTLEASLMLYARICQTDGSGFPSLSAADMFKLTKEAFDGLSITNLYEKIVAYGGVSLISQIPGLDVKHSEYSRLLLNYLWSQVIIRPTPHLDSVSYYETAPWMIDCQVDTCWGGICTLPLNAQPIPLLLQHTEIELLRLALFGSTHFNIPLAISGGPTHRKILICLFLERSTTLRNSRKSYMPKLCVSDFLSTNIQEEDWPGADIVIEVNIAQLFNETYSSLQRPLKSLFKLAKYDHINSLLDTMKAMIYPERLCHRKVVLVGGFSADPQKAGPSLLRTFKASRDRLLGSDCSTEQNLCKSMASLAPNFV